MRAIGQSVDVPKVVDADSKAKFAKTAGSNQKTKLEPRA